MPFVTSTRWSGSRLSSQRILNGASAGQGCQMDSATEVQSTYSFRTGDGLKLQDTGQSAKLDPQSEVYKPTGNIVDRLAYRKSFIERQMTSILSRNGAPAHFLLGDMGHEFGTYRVKVTATDNSVVTNSGGTANTQFVNVRPSLIRVMRQDGLLATCYPTTADVFSGYFQSKGSPFTTSAGIDYGPSMTVMRSHASGHISELNPFKKKASVLASLIELARGDVPNLLKSLREHFTLISRMKASGIKDASKALGSEYLNNVFGWSPILRDVNASIQVLLTLDQLLFPEDDTRRRVNRTISLRGGTFTGSIPHSGAPALGAGSQASYIAGYTNSFSKTSSYTAAGNLPGSFTGENSVLEKYSLWTTARFQTNARPSTTNNGHLDRMIDLLGLELTPEVLWELTPWSWLIDWFSNMGTVIGNLSTLGLSNTILNYAYATARLETTGGIWCRPTIVPSGAGVRSFTGNFIYTYKLDAKVRIAASPFGFAVTNDSLNAGQLAILTALGLARSR